MNDTLTPAEKARANRSAAVSKTWTDPGVAASRAARHQVTVGLVQYRSVGAAFDALGLPATRHVAFRQKLKASPTGKANFQVEGDKPGTVVDYVFAIVPPADPEQLEGLGVQP